MLEGLKNQPYVAEKRIKYIHKDLVTPGKAHESNTQQINIFEAEDKATNTQTTVFLEQASPVKNDLNIQLVEIPCHICKELVMPGDDYTCHINFAHDIF